MGTFGFGPSGAPLSQFGVLSCRGGLCSNSGHSSWVPPVGHLDSVHTLQSTPALLVMMSSFFILVGLVAHLTIATFRVISPLDSPFSGRFINSPPDTRFLGPQFCDQPTPITARLLLYTGDICTWDPDPDTVRGRAVVHAPDAYYFPGCSYEAKYEKFDRKGVAAFLVFWYVDQIPSLTIHVHDGRYGETTRHKSMLFLRVENVVAGSKSLLEYLVDALKMGNQINVELTPDSNSEWDTMYSSWTYQILVRWIPFLILSLTCVFSFIFICIHMLILSDRYNDQTSAYPQSRTIRRRMKYIFHNGVRIHHVVLMIEFVTTLVMSIFIGVGGWWSTANLPLAVNHYFATALSGWGFTCDVLAAILWSDLLHQVAPVYLMSAWFNRILSHKIARIALLIFPLMLDTIVSLMYSMHCRTANLDTVTALVMIVLQLIVGVHFLVQTFRYQVFAKQSVSRHHTEAGAKIVEKLNRLTKWTIMLSLAMFVYVVTLPMATLPQLYTPWGWTTFWSIEWTARSITSLCRVMMFRPQRRRLNSNGKLVIPSQS